VSDKKTDEPKPPTWIELASVIPLETRRADELSVRKITNLSPEAIVENYADKVRRLSAKRVGMSLGDALEIASGKAKSAT
jgi:hypothetical protein